MRLAFVAAPIVLALAACASPEPEKTEVVAVASTPGSSHLECHQESDTGSNMIHKVCRRTLNDGERQQTQEDISTKLHDMARTTLPKSN
jgi:hypothetical protein